MNLYTYISLFATDIHADRRKDSSIPEISARPHGLTGNAITLGVGFIV